MGAVKPLFGTRMYGYNGTYDDRGHVEARTNMSGFRGNRSRVRVKVATKTECSEFGVWFQNSIGNTCAAWLWLRAKTGESAFMCCGFSAFQFQRINAEKGINPGAAKSLLLRQRGERHSHKFARNAP